MTHDGPDPIYNLIALLGAQVESSGKSQQTSAAEQTPTPRTSSRKQIRTDGGASI
jgi:hypothetical protein